ncbi:MAG: hypothetical protein NC081_00065 [Roseburia sp.]|nr:hypothetical protein [Roseburia sp.]
MKKIHISQMTMISLFIFFLSICGMVVCVIKTMAYHHAQPLTYFSEGSLKPGKYVSGTITSYVVNQRRPKGKNVDDSIYSFGNLYNIFTNEEYIGYLIPFNEEQYIKIWIKDEESLALLREVPDGLDVNVSFIGQIEYQEEAEYEDDVLGFDHNKVITNYVIFQKNLSSEKFWIKVCLTGIIISFFLYWFKGRIVVSEAVYEDKNPQSIPCYADTSAEIVSIERRIKMYGKIEKEYRIGGCIGAVCAVIGVSVFVKFGSFSALVTFIILTGYGLSRLWKYFINSRNPLALFIARLFNIRTLQIKCMEDYKLLNQLKMKEDI